MGFVNFSTIYDILKEFKPGVYWVTTNNSEAAFRYYLAHRWNQLTDNLKVAIINTFI